MKNCSKDKLQSWCKLCKNKGIGDYYKLNPNKKFKRTKEMSLKRYYENKISFNFSRRIRQSLHNLNKKHHWEELVGYSLLELKTHLQNKFDKNMNWENYGSYWHIDHVIPISKFNITSNNCEDFKACWSLDNLQPLEAKENMSKSNKIFL